MRRKPLRFVLSEKDITNKTLVEFYEAVGGLMGETDPSVKFDCRQILISENIQDEFYYSYQQFYDETFPDKPINVASDVTIMLAQCGPKVEHSLPPNTVEVQGGFIVR